MSHHHLANASRRGWLKRTGLSAGSALASGVLGSLLLPAGRAQAADYKALVCLFLHGGNDGMNTVVPTDAGRYGEYAAVRKLLALPQAGLLPLTGSQYGLHPALSALQTAWQERRLAPVFNVGPLAAPLTKAAYRAAAPNSALLPGNLFSHSDQQILWESASADPHARTGWGGRAAETLATGNPVISVGGNGRFGLSTLAVPLVVPEPGVNFGAYELGSEPWRLQSAPSMARANTLRSMYRQVQDNDLAEAYTRMQRDAFEVSARLAAVVRTQPGDSDANAAINSAFAPLIAGGKVTTPLGRQLYQAAKLIAARTVVGGDRQIFFAQQGGFDTHGGQVASNPLEGHHAVLLKTLGDAVAAFDAAMKNLGLSNSVTLFTQSDFGRTFKPNSTYGTDHAWGNHHLVLGGAVKGGATYGSYPELVLGGKDDVGQDSWELHGRWIPTTSVDQYAATLLSWFGATDAQLDQVLPNLAAFGAARRLPMF